MKLELILNNSLDLVSIIINCHNAEMFIEKSLQSALQQTHKYFEIIVFDNCSLDNTARLVQNLKKDNAVIKYFYHNKYEPLGSVRNFAIEKASGDWIAFLDSDDLWSKTYLEDQLKCLIEYKGEVFGYGRVKEFTYDSEIEDKLEVNHRKPNPENLFYKLLKGNFIYWSSLVIHKNIWMKYRYFNPVYKQAEDYEIGRAHV